MFDEDTKWHLNDIISFYCLDAFNCSFLSFIAKSDLPKSF